jgi:hypothetical protein
MFWQPVEDAAPSFDVEPMQAPVRDVGEIERTVAAFARQNGGLMVLPDVSTTNHRDLIIALAARHRLPAVYPYRYFATSGGLMSYVVAIWPMSTGARPPIENHEHFFNSIDPSETLAASDFCIPNRPLPSVSQVTKFCFGGPS